MEACRGECSKATPSGALEFRTGLWHRYREGLEISAGEQASRGTLGGVFSWEGTGIVL